MERDKKFNYLDNCHLHSEINRLLTFNGKVSFVLFRCLAKLGFYFVEKDTLVICIFCDLHLSCSELEDFVKHHVTHDCNHRRENRPWPNNYKDYRYECNRLLTFLEHSWPKLANSKHPVGALDLASSGFICLGEGDQTKCTFCLLKVSGWATGDVAEIEHRKFNPECPFIKGRNVGNIKLRQEQLSCTLDCDAVKYLESSSSNCTDKIDEDKKENCTSNNPVKSNESKGPKHVKYEDLSARQTSFKWWPISLISLAQLIVEAGFFYTNRADRVICHYCGGGLKDWNTKDDPWIEHAVWFPECEFLTKNKSPEFINRAQELKKEFIKKRDEERNQSEIALKNTSDDGEDKKDKKCESNSSVSLCTICNDKELAIVLIPCGHMATCRDCIQGLEICPICENKFSAFIKAHIA